MVFLHYSLVALLMALLSIATFSRNTVWRNPVTLWSDVVIKSPEKSKGHYNLGALLARQQRFAQAELHSRKALALSPGHKTHNNLGSIYFLQGRVLEAERHFELALRYNAASPDIHYNLGLLCLNQGRLGEAARHFNDAVVLDPDLSDAWNALALIAQRQGRFTDAATYKEQAHAFQSPQ